MAVNPDAQNLLEIEFTEPREGSCLTRELLNELKGLIRIRDRRTATSGGACISGDANNLARLDAQNCILVPGNVLYRESQTWSFSGGEELEFEEFAYQLIDATTCMLSVHIYHAADETGVEVQKQPTGSAFIWPSFEITERSAGKIKIDILNATKDVRVEIELLQLPLPPETP
jgi:hypothetical protein